MTSKKHYLDTARIIADEVEANKRFFLEQKEDSIGRELIRCATHSAGQTAARIARSLADQYAADSKRELLAGLRAERDELAERVKMLDTAIMGLSGGGLPEKVARRSPTGPRTRNRKAVQEEIIRVLSSNGGGPMTVREIYDAGTFTCTTGGVFSAARDLPTLARETRIDGRATFHLPRETRIRAGEGEIRPRGGGR